MDTKRLFSRKHIERQLLILLGTVFGVGFVPIFSGTAGTLIAVPLFHFYQNHYRIYCFFFFLLLLLSFFVCSKLSMILGKKDPKEIVLDEVVGFSCALFFAKPLWKECFALFILFRFWDISKLWPVSLVDRSSAPWAIVGDDLLAGFLAGVSWIILKKVYFYGF